MAYRSLFKTIQNPMIIDISFFCNYLLALQGELCAKYSSWRLCFDQQEVFKNIYYISSVNEKMEFLMLYFFLMINGQITLKLYVWAMSSSPPFFIGRSEFSVHTLRLQTSTNPHFQTQRKAATSPGCSPDLLQSQQKASLPLSWDVLWHFHTDPFCTKLSQKQQLLTFD